MSYSEPTIPLFKLRFPEFECVNNELVELVLADAISDVGDGWDDKDRARGQLLLAAHTLALEGEPARSRALDEGRTPNSPAAGQMIELQDRDVRVELSDKESNIAGSSNLGDLGRSYMQTPYGKDYYQLLKRNTGSFCVV